MKTTLLLLGFCFLSVSPATAGGVYFIAGSPGVGGKLTLGQSTIHVEGSAASDIHLSDILEADFSDTPFHLDYFSSDGDTSSGLPAGWKGQDIGQAVVPGSVSYAEGQFTLTGNQRDPPNDKDPTDRYFVAGIPWTGDGQWTARVKSMDVPPTGLQGGLMVRESLDPFAVEIGAAASTWNMATIFIRWREHSTSSSQTPFDALPIWLRLTRSGSSVDLAVSEDGKQWVLSGLGSSDMAESCWVGFFINSHATPDKADEKIVFDHVRFSPPPGPAPDHILPPGVLLRSGSFLAGHFDQFDLSDPTPIGKFNRKGNSISIPAALIAAVDYHPVKRSQLAELGSNIGVILKNQDVVEDGSFVAINSSGVSFNSISLGNLNYDVNQMCACNLSPVQLRSADYEIRLKDGSSIRANGMSTDNGQFLIEEISGLKVTVAPGELAQVRAGSSRVQSLLGLAWKANGLETGSDSQPVTPAVAETKAAPVADTAPASNAVPDKSSLVQCWTGNNQEQIMVAPAGTTVDFPCAAKFRAVALRIALSPDSPPHAQATLRVLADGKEITRTPSIKMGDQPLFTEVRVAYPKTVSLAVDSAVPGTRVLFIDPVAVRASAR